MRKTKEKEVEVSKGLIHVRLTMIEPVLGSAPADPEIYSTYVQSKAPVKDQDELDTLNSDFADEMDKKITIFHKLEDGTLFIYDNVIKGFFKNACKNKKQVSGSASSKVTAFKTKIDGLVFISQRRLPFKEASEVTMFERPLRAETMQGPRTALSCSERIEAGCKLEFDIELLAPAMYGAVVEWLDYGRYNGLCQWHNGGYGRFLYEELDDNGNVISSNLSLLDNYDKI